MQVQIQLNNRNDLSKNLFIEVSEDNIKIDGSQTDNFLRSNPDILSDFSIYRIMKAIDEIDLDVTAMAYPPGEHLDECPEDYNCPDPLEE